MISNLRLMIILDKIETIIFDGIENMFLIMFLRILSSRFGVLCKGFIFRVVKVEIRMLI